MGSVTRHAEIFVKNYPHFKDIRKEDFIFLHLGNFLTDFSQFRDPFAHLSAKERIKKQATVTKAHGFSVFLKFAHFDQWSDIVFGSLKDKTKRFGKLAEFFEQISLAVTHIIFADDIPKKELIRTLVDFISPEIGFASSAEVDRIFKENFTQYYPHEHLDMPPWFNRRAAKLKSNAKEFNTIVSYLVSQKKFIIEELTKLEKTWKQQKDLPQENPKRHDRLVQLGKLLHPCEDYFFHSNFVEIFLWRSRKNRQPTQINMDTFRNLFAASALKNYENYKGYEAYQDLSIDTLKRWTRVLLRRLRYPLYDHDLPSRKVSDTADDLVYTGGFEANDIFYTIVNALDSLSDVFQNVFTFGSKVEVLKNATTGKPSNFNLSNPLRSDLTLINVIFDDNERKKLVNQKYLDEAIARHSVDLKGLYGFKIEGLLNDGWLNKQAHDALQKAFEIDKEITSAFSRAPGIGGLLMTILSTAEEQVGWSVQASNNLDLNGQRLYIDDNSFPTDNGSSAEQIGTHSLMSKDTPKSQPLYEDARVLAKYASLSVITIMLNELNNADTTKATAWMKVIQNYLKFPVASSTTWEAQALNFYRGNGNFPVVGDLKDIHDAIDPSFRISTSQLESLKNGKTKEQLENAYKKMEEKIKG